LEFAEFAVAILDIVANLDRRRILERTGYRADQGRRHRFGCKAELVAHRQREARECLPAGGTQREFAGSYSAGQATISPLAV
jgi:hypothetical protein